MIISGSAGAADGSQSRVGARRSSQAMAIVVLLLSVSALQLALAGGPAGWPEIAEHRTHALSFWYSPDGASHLTLHAPEPLGSDEPAARIDAIVQAEIDKLERTGQLRNASQWQWHGADGEPQRLATVTLLTRRQQQDFVENLFVIVNGKRQWQRARLMSLSTNPAHDEATDQVAQYLLISADIPAAPEGWTSDLEANPDANAARAGVARYTSPDGQLLVYLSAGQSPGELTPARWLSAFNHRQNFDENGSRAYTLSEVDVEQFAGRIVARQTVFVETDGHEPFLVQTLAVFREDEPVQWGAIVHLATGRTTHPLQREAIALVYSARRPAFAALECCQSD